LSKSIYYSKSSRIINILDGESIQQCDHILMDEYYTTKSALIGKYLLRKFTEDEYYKVINVYITPTNHIGIQCKELFRKKEIILSYVNSMKSFMSMYDYVNKWEIIYHQLREE